MKTFINAILGKAHIREGGLAIALFSVLMLFSVQDSFGQTKTYLEGQKTGNFYEPGTVSTGAASISSPVLEHRSGGFNVFRFYYGPTNILTSLTGNSTTMTASAVNAAVKLTGANVYLQFRNTTGITTAGTPTYFKLGAQPSNSGLNVNAGALLGLDNIYNIKGSAYKGATDYSLSGAGDENNGNPVVNDGQTVTKLLIDKNNIWHAAVTPTSADNYNAVRLKVALPTGFNIVSVASVSTTVFNAFTMAPGDVCSTRPIFTGFGNTAITLTSASLLGGLNLSELVADASMAIDDDATSYSKFSNGLASVGVANIIAQEVLFDHTATANDAVKIHLALNPALITLDVLSGGVTLKAYKGTSNTAVATQSLQSSLSLLGLNLANILTINSDGFVDINTSFKPGVVFDRIEVSLNGSLIDASVVGNALRLYDVELSSPAPAITASISLGANNSVTVFEGASLPKITASSPGNNISWFEGNNTTALAGSPKLSPFDLPVTSIATAGEYVYYAATSTPGCTNLSAKVPVNITVLTTPLPVTLASFNIKKENETALLSWSTTSESNSESFDIERSQNGKEWNKIASKVAKGESLSLVNYSYTDGLPLEGENLYRLKMIDRDGTFAFSRIESVNFALDADLKLYPNPVVNFEYLQIGVRDWNLVKSVKIINAAGNMVFESTGSLIAGVQTDKLKSGLYFVQVTKKDGKITTYKFVKL